MIARNTFFISGDINLEGATPSSQHSAESLEAKTQVTELQEKYQKAQSDVEDLKSQLDRLTQTR